MHIRVIVAAGVTAFAVAASPARGEVIAHEHNATPVAAYGNYAAWSRVEGKHYRLVIWHDGKLGRAAVAPSPAQFDVDLGHDAAGRVVAVYSRCAKTERFVSPDFMPDPSQEHSCDIYEYDVVSRYERRLAGPSRKGTSEYWPAISGHRLVFARMPRKARLPQIVSATLGQHYREHPLPRPASHPTHYETSVGATSIDVAGNRAVIGWEYVAGDNDCGGAGEKGIRPLVHAVVLYDLTTRRRTVLDNDCHLSAARGVAFANPSLDAGHVFYSAYVELPDYVSPTIRAVSITGRATHDSTFPIAVPASLYWTQTAGGWTWATTGHGFPDVSYSIERARAQP
jgi:hypothetical protein